MTESFEAPDQPFCGSKDVALVEVIRAEVLIFGSALEHVVAGGENGTGNGNERTLGAPEGRKASELRLQVGPFGLP